MTAAHWLSKNLKEGFAIPDDAREWLMSLWNAIQVFDDVADGDPVEREDLLNAICDTLVNMPANPFFLRHGATLLPLMAVAILKWKAADDAERSGESDETSYVWRAGYYDIVLAVIQLVHGQQVALDVCREAMKLYGEPFSEYKKEMECRVQQ